MPKTDCTPLQELAAYAALPGGIKRPEEYLRLARLALAEVAEQIDKHPTLPNGDKWRLLNSHPSAAGAGLNVLSRLIQHTEGRMLEALEEAAHCHNPTVMRPGADAALHGLPEVRNA